MLSDRFTAKVLGLVVIVMGVLIDASFFVLSRPPPEKRMAFAAIVILPSIPIFLFGIYLLRRAESLKEPGGD